jgi:hypothetical protein
MDFPNNKIFNFFLMFISTCDHQVKSNLQVNLARVIKYQTCKSISQEMTSVGALPRKKFRMAKFFSEDLVNLAKNNIKKMKILLLGRSIKFHIINFNNLLMSTSVCNYCNKLSNDFFGSCSYECFEKNTKTETCPGCKKVEKIYYPPYCSFCYITTRPIPQESQETKYKIHQYCQHNIADGECFSCKCPTSTQGDSRSWDYCQECGGAAYRVCKEWN